LTPTSTPNPIPPLASPAPTPAALAGIQTREIIPLPMLPEIRPNATVLPFLPLVLGTMNVLFTA
jgi:hypothetical protein